MKAVKKKSSKTKKTRRSGEMKKFQAGTAVIYISRSQAMKKLQLSLRDFRRLCILKGIYPHEPKQKKKANKGSTENKTYYYLKDILFLAHEPIIGKFREYKVFVRRLRRATDKKDEAAVERLSAEPPSYRLDQVVKERYPSLVDAVRDLDDALSLAALFARLPSSALVKPPAVHLCRRLAAEFMHFVIGARALRKVFVSIKGIYYQADVLGETVTWIVPHERAQSEVSDVDFAIMATFIEFYTTMIGFVNFGLFRQLGLHYPPKLRSQTAVAEDSDECVYSLGQDIQSDGDGLSDVGNALPDEFPADESEEQVEQARRHRAAVENLKSLFKDCRVFLNREVPLQSLAFVIRACGGAVSWSESAGYGAPFAEDDERVTHQVVDRTLVGSDRRVSRYYVQPQWVYDCVNARRLLPAACYLVGEILPPHLSPFVADNDGYVPSGATASIESPAVSSEATNAAKKKEKKDVSVEKVNAVVAVGVERPKGLHNAAGEQKKLREMMIPKKHRRVYKKMKFAQKRKAREVETLAKKRKAIESAAL